MGKRKKKKITDEDVRRSLGPEFYERHERTQRLLAEAIAYHEQRARESQND